MSLDLEEIDVAHMLESLDIENVSEEGPEVRFSCPFPGHANGDRNASAYMNADTTMFMCHGCHEKGNATNFVSKVLEITPLEANHLLRQAYQPGAIDPNERRVLDEVRGLLKHEPIKVTTPQQPILPEEALADFITNDTLLDYTFGRGFDEETVAEWELLYWAPESRLVIPIRDHFGRLVGLKGRSIQPEAKGPKYKALNLALGWPNFHKSMVLFGLHRAIRENKRDLVVCEGELNAIACWQVGVPAVAINGSIMSDIQAELLVQEADSLTLYFDNDASGLDCTFDVDLALRPFLPIKVVMAESTLDAADHLKAGRGYQIREEVEHAISSTVAKVVLRSQFAASA